MDRFRHQFGDYELGDLSIDNILDFMNQLTEGRKPQTKRVRFTSLQAFFNFAKNNLDTDFTNACDSPMLRKLFRPKVKTQFDILEKETVDEIIFRTVHPRNRLMLELMARGAMRIFVLQAPHLNYTLQVANLITFRNIDRIKQSQPQNPIWPVDVR